MQGKFASIVLTAAALLATGCKHRAAYESRTQERAMSMIAVGGGGGNVASYDVVNFVYASQRFIAEHHTLQLVSSESQLQKSWDATVAFCATIRCEVVTSRITARTATPHLRAKFSCASCPTT